MLKLWLSVVRPFGIVASRGQPPRPIPPVLAGELGFARSISRMRPGSLLYANDAQLYRAGSTALLGVTVGPRSPQRFVSAPAALQADFGKKYPRSLALNKPHPNSFRFFSG